MRTSGTNAASVLDATRLESAVGRQRENLAAVLAAYGSNAGEEGLHDLRVSLRRSAAVGRLLEDFPEKEAGRKLRRKAGRLRRHLSPARQAQVSLQLARSLAGGDDALLREVAPALAGGSGRYRTPGIADVQREGKEVLAAFDPWLASIRSSSPTAAQSRALAASVSSRLQEDARRVLALGVPGKRSLHRQRIACKRLRYEVEILHELVPSAARLLKAMRSVQDTMGDAHDWACLFEDLSRAFPEAGPRAEIRALVEEAGRRRKRSRADVRRAMKGFLPLVEPLTRWAPAPARGGRPARVRRKPAGR